MGFAIPRAFHKRSNFHASETPWNDEFFELGRKDSATDPLHKLINTDQPTRDLDVDGDRALSSFLNRPHCAVGPGCESDWAEPLGDVGTLGDPCIERLHETPTVPR